MLNSTITATALAELRRTIGERALSCIHEPKGLLPYHFVTPTCEIEPGADDGASVSLRSLIGLYLHAYDWDALIFADAAGRLLGIKWLLLPIVKNFLAHQRKDGFVPRTISTHRIWDEGDPCKPFMCQMLIGALQRGDITEDDVAPLLAPIENLLLYYRRRQFNKISRLYYWPNVLASGVDSNPSLLFPREAHVSENVNGRFVVDYPDGRLLATDLNAYMYAELLAFSKLCDRCGDQKRATRYERLATDLQQRIETTLWDDDLGMYINVDPLTGEKVAIRSWTGLAPTLFGLSPSDRSRRVITENILSEEHFLRPFGIASLAASDHLHNQAPRALYGRARVCNWSGPIWVLPNALVARFLVACGLIKEARDVATRILRAVINDLATNNTTHENYDADTGRPLWAPKFMSWNILVLELANLLESDSSLGTTSQLVTA